MSERGTVQSPLGDTEELLTYETLPWRVQSVDQAQDVARLKQRVFRLHSRMGETGSFEQDWCRWLQLIEAFNLSYAMQLITEQEQIVRR